MCSHCIARLFNDVGKFSMFKINFFLLKPGSTFGGFSKNLIQKQHEGIFREFSYFIGKEGVDDSSLDQWSWTGVSYRNLSLFLSLGTCSHRLPNFPFVLAHIIPTRLYHSFWT